jgi:hypothetical protein
MRTRVPSGNVRTKSRARRGLVGTATVIALCAAALVAAGTPAAQAATAPGDNVTPWSTGWSWKYATNFLYNDGQGTNVNMNETVTYTVLGHETHLGQDSYKLGITGTIDNGSGNAQSGTTSISLSNFSGTVAGTRWVRRSDLALVEDNEVQNLSAKADGLVSITAVITLDLVPTPAWRIHDFPLNAGDNWQTSTSIAYTGGFDYNAGSFGSGSSPFAGTIPFNAPTNVTAESLNPGIGNLVTDKITAVDTPDQMSDTTWWAPSVKNDGKEILVLPLNGSAMTITRNLTASSTPSGTTLSATTTPNLTCAGANVTVAGALSTGAAGVPVTVQLDEGSIGTGPSATTTTGVGGAYSVSLPAPATSDGLAKNATGANTATASRANWGILVTTTSPDVNGASTLVVSPADCTSIAYTGDSAGKVSGSATVSAQITDLANQANAAGRVVTFSLSGGGSVNGTTNSSGVATATLPMNGPVRTTTITASFAGASDLVAATTAAPFSVQVNPTTTSVVPSLSVAEQGQNITFTATVNPTLGSNPTGTIQFVVDGNALGAAVTTSGGTATSAAINSLGLGTHTVTATYNGDLNFAPSSSPPATFTVRTPRLATSTTIAANQISTVYGQPITLSSHVSSTSGSGNVSTAGSVIFSDGGNVLGTGAVNASGDASVVVSTLPVGTHSIVATYSSNDEYSSSASGPKSISVAKASVVVGVTSSKATTVSGEAVNYSTSVAAAAPGAGVPDGTVQLVVDGSNTGSPVTLSGGVANFAPVTSLGAGNHAISVTYSGSGNYAGGSGSTHQSVTKADTSNTVLISPSPSSEGQVTNITATIGVTAPGSGAATGLVTFTSDGSPIGSASLVAAGGGAKATLPISTLAPGSHTIVATYGGDANYNGSTSAPVSHTVIAGAAVIDTSTTLSSSVNPSTYGQFVTYTAAVTAADGSAASGAVQFSVDGTNVGIPVGVASDGTATSPLLASPEPGDHTVIAAFVGNPGYANSGQFLSQTVADASSAVAVSSSSAASTYGQSVTFSARVTTPQSGVGTPGGKVQFRVDGIAIGGAVTLAGGQATSPGVSTLTPGTHTVTATYSGDTHFTAGLDTMTQTVSKVSTATTLVATPSSVNYGQTVALTATVTPGNTALGAPTGTVTFTDGTTTLATVVLGASGNNGTASYSAAGLGGGSHPIKATYSGSASFAGSASATSTVTVAKLATTITARGALVNVIPLVLALGQLQAFVNSANGPVPGVPVAFTVGTATVCTSYTDAYGVANCNAVPQLVSLTLLGYKATYAGDGNYLGSTATGAILK